MKPTEDLFLIIKSLQPTEKSYFKKFTKLHVLGDGNNYIRLFEAIEKQDIYNEQLVREQFKGEKFLNQLWVAKNYLYHQVLKCLEVYHMGNDNEIKSHLRRIEILYEKGLYKQCEKIIDKAMEISIKQEHFTSLLEILKWQLKIYQVHSYSGITSTELHQWYESITATISQYKNQVDFSYEIARAFSKRKKTGFARKEEDVLLYTQIANSPLFKDEKNAHSFEAKNNFYLIKVLYHISKNSAKAHLYTKKQVELYNSYPEQIVMNPGLYLTTLHNHILISRRMGREKEIGDYITKVKNVNANTSIIKGKKYFYANIHELKLLFNSNRLKDVVKLIGELRNNKTFFQNEKHLNPNDKTALYYDMGYYNFIAGHYKEAAKLFHTIINDFPIDVKSDFHCFSRIQLLLVYFESGKSDLLEYTIKSTHKYLKKNHQLYRVENIILGFLKKLIKIDGATKQMRVEYVKLQAELEKIFKNPYERNALNYFDFLSWIESKTNNLSFYSSIRRNRTGE